MGPNSQPPAFLMFRFVVIFGGAAAMDLFLLDESVYGDKGGRCLDGSMAGYYYDPPPSGKSEVWVINLAGGGFCMTQKDCESLAKTPSGSSKKWPKTMNAGSISPLTAGSRPSWMMSDENTMLTILRAEFYDAHHVYVPYCSADDWCGTIVTPTEKQFGYYYSGHLSFGFIVDNILETIPAARNAKDILVIGYSAGGMGSIFNCDITQDKFASTGSSAKVKCASIGGWDFSGYSDDQDDVTMPPSTWPRWSIGKSGGRIFPRLLEISILQDSYITEDCAKIHGLKCNSVSVMYPYFKSPLFIAKHQYDSYTLAEWQDFPPYMALFPQGQAYMEYFSRSVRNSTQKILKPGDGLFFPSCFDHTGSFEDTTLVKGFSCAQALADWFYGRGKVPRVLVDDCEFAPGVPCNPTCDFLRSPYGGFKAASGSLSQFRRSEYLWLSGCLLVVCLFACLFLACSSQRESKRASGQGLLASEGGF